MAEMTSRERVKKAIGFDYPDRPPISHAILPSAILKHGDSLRAILAGVREDFGWDYLPDLPLEKFPPYYRKGRNRDGLGVLWECSEDGEYGLPVGKAPGRLVPLCRLSLARLGGKASGLPPLLGPHGRRGSSLVFPGGLDNLL